MNPFDVPLDDDIAAQAPVDTRSQFGRGLDAGVLGAGSQLQALAGGVGAAVGADDFARARYARSAELAQEAQRVGPRITSYRDVHGLGDFGDYAAGLFGQAIPSVAAGVGAGAVAGLSRGRISPLLAGTAAQAPLEVGDVLQRQELDPEARSMGAGERLGLAAGLGGLAAVGQGLVPTALGGRLVGAGAKGAARAGLAGSVARDAVTEGLAEGGGELVKQQGVGLGAAPDWQAAAESAVGGAVVGGGLGGAGHVAESAHNVPGGIGGAISGAVGRARDAAQGLAGGAKEAIQRQVAPPSTADRLDAALEPDDTARRLQDGTPLGDLAQYATRAGEDAYNYVAENTKKAADWTADRAGKLAERADLDDATKQQLRDAAATATDRASQALVAGKDVAMKAKDSVVAAMDDMLAKASAWTKERSAAKESADTTSARARIVQALRPYVGDELFNDPAAVTKLGQATMVFIEAVKSGDLDRMQQASDGIAPVLGDRADEALAKVYDVVATSDPNETKRFFAAVDGVRESRQRELSLEQVVQASLPPESRADAKQLARVLSDWALDADGGDTHLAAERKRFQHELERRKIEQIFGDKAEGVFNHLQKLTDSVAIRTAMDGEDQSVAAQQRDEEGRVGKYSEIDKLEEGQAGKQVFGARGKSGAKVFGANALLMNPDSYQAKYGKTDSATHKLMTELRNRYPEADVYWRTAADVRKDAGLEGGDTAKGYVVVEQAQEGQGLKPEQISAARLATGNENFRESKSRIDVPLNASQQRIYGQELILDAVKLTQQAKKDMASDGSTDAARSARAFMSAIADLMAEHGAFPLPNGNDTVIAPKLTWGEAKQALRKDGPSVDADDQRASAGSDGDRSLRGQLSDAVQRLRDVERRMMSVEVLGRKMEGWRDNARTNETYQKWNEAVQAQLEKYRKAKNKVAALEAKAQDAQGPAEAEADAERRGIQDTSKTENIHSAAALQGEDALRVKSDLAGNPVSAPRQKRTAVESETLKQAVVVARKLQASDKPIARGVGAKLRALASVENALSAKDIRKLHDLIQRSDAERTVSSIAPAVNELHAKYEGVLTRPEPKPAEPKRPAEKEEDPSGPKAVAAKKAALRKAASSSDPALAKEIKATDDAAALQRSVEFLNGQVEHYMDSVVAGDIESLRAQTDEEVSLLRFELDDDLTPQQREARELRIAALETRAEAFAASMAQTEANAAIMKALAGGETSLGKVLDAAFEHLTPAQQAVARALATTAKDIKVRLADYDGAFGRHSTEAGIELNRGIVKNLAATVLLHEGVHAATVRALVADRHLSAATELLMEDSLAQDKTLKAEYGWTNVKEFVAEALTNPALQEKLRGLKASSAADTALAGRSIWQKFVDLVRGALGLGAGDGSALDQALRLGGAIMQAQAQGVGAGLKRDTAFVKTVDQMNARLDHLVQDPDVAYNLLRKHSRETVAPGQAGPVDRAAVEKIITDRLGDSVAVAWTNILHAGEFTRTKDSETGFVYDAINLSVHSLNPKSVAYHEALHAFFAQLRDNRQFDVTRVLETAAEKPHIRRQINEFFAGNKEVLEQIRNDPEERAAYMYQLWATGNLDMGAGKDLFERITDFLRSVLGIWSNEQRALHILDYFNSGEYAKNIAKPNAVYKALMEPGRNKAVDSLEAMVQPLRNLGESVLATGAARLRDTEIGPLKEIADLVKPLRTDDARDEGYIAASREERASRMNRLAAALDGYTPEQMREALDALHLEQKAVSKEGRLVQLAVRKHLTDMLAYLKERKVVHGGLGPTYFPRVWNADYILSNQDEFRAMLASYPQYAGKADGMIAVLSTNGGNDFAVDTRTPGFQSGKERVLADVSAQDAAPFLNKNLLETLNSYTAQATRRGEWASRFGADSAGIAQRLSAARKQGATERDIEVTERYLRGVNGTLGDNINPTTRRAIGSLMVYQNIRLLPLAIFSSVVDPMGIMVRGGSLGDAWTAFKRGVKDVPKNFKAYDPAAHDASTKLAEMLGTIDNAVLTQDLGTAYGQGMVGGTGRKLNDLLFRFNLMEGWNNSMRVAATETALKFIQQHATAPGKHSARWLAELGLDADDVQVDQGLGRPKLTQAEGLTAAQEVRMRAAVNRWVDGAVLRPDSADKPIWFNDPHLALFSHLKQFVYSFQKTILDRVAHEYQHGNYVPAMALAGYVPVMIAADYLKGMIQGGGEQPAWKKDWGPTDYLWHGVQRAGLLGVSQFKEDAVEDIHRGGSGVGALMGPTVDQLIDGVEVAGGRKRFERFAVDAMPANDLYQAALD